MRVSCPLYLLLPGDGDDWEAGLECPCVHHLLDGHRGGQGILTGQRGIYGIIATACPLYSVQFSVYLGKPLKKSYVFSLCGP